MSSDTKTSLQRAASKMLGGSLAVVVLQAINFALLARSLGAAEYGTLATINSAASLLLPLAGLGYGSVMLMRVAREAQHAPVALGNALSVQLVTGSAGAAIGAAAVVMISSTPVAFGVALIVLLGELVFMRTAVTAAQLFSALEQQGRASVINVATSCARVASVLVAIIVSDRVTALVWASLFLAFSIMFAAALIWFMARAAGGLSVEWKAIGKDLGHGTDFSLGTLAKAIYTDADKLVLARFGTAADVGTYAAAYRVAAMSFMPVRAMLDAAAGRFFRQGQGGIAQALALSRRVLTFALPYSLGVAAVLVLGADYLPLVFGAGYAKAIPLIKWLAVLPVIQAVHYTLSDALSGAGYQRYRMVAQFVVVVFYLATALVVIPQFRAPGAALTCLASELLLAVIIAALVITLYRRQKESR
ncbi:lipopolysaccharide biosynthesis protein [Roseateles sp. P5_D6]